MKLSSHETKVVLMYCDANFRTHISDSPFSAYSTISVKRNLSDHIRPGPHVIPFIIIIFLTKEAS